MTARFQNDPRVLQYLLFNMKGKIDMHAKDDSGQTVYEIVKNRGFSDHISIIDTYFNKIG